MIKLARDVLPGELTSLSGRCELVFAVVLDDANDAVGVSWIGRGVSTRPCMHDYMTKFVCYLTKGAP